MSEEHTQSLDSVDPGHTVEMIGLKIDGPLCLRLAELGLTPETEVCVLQAQPGQPLLLAVRDSRLALDRALAQGVLVRACHKNCHKCQWGGGKGRWPRWLRGH